MDKQDAKLILSNYTLGNEPLDDERFEAAKAMTAADPDLAAWWKAQKAEDQLIRERLARSTVPEDLRSALHETLLHQRAKGPILRRFRSWVAIAASLALVSYLAIVFGIDRSDDYQGPLQNRAYNYSVDGPRLKYFDRDPQNLKTWLTQNGFDLPLQLPPKLLELEGIGCRPLNWSEQRVALMCFNADTVYHLFIGRGQDFPEFSASEEIGYTSYENGWTLSKWRDGEHIFVLSAKATANEMAGFLASYDPAARVGRL